MITFASADDLPAELPTEGWQVVGPATSTITQLIGRRLDVAQMISVFTGELIPAEFLFMSFVGQEFASFTAVLFRDARRPSCLVMVAHSGGLHLSRTILRTVAQIAFEGAGASEIITGISPNDLPRREALNRLGFTYAGREIRSDGERILLVLRPDTIPASFRRARLRQTQ